VWSLSLVVVAEAVASTSDTAVPPKRRDTVPIKAAFHVGWIEDLRSAVTGLGGRVDPPSTRWGFRGVRRSDALHPRGMSSSCCGRLTLWR
jgi:hypothetical protein